MPRISPSEVEKFPVHFPASLPEQQRIAGILDQADVIRRKSREASIQFDALAASLFLTFFNKELSSAPRRSLAQHLVDLRYGTSNKSAPQGIPALRIPNVLKGVIDLRDLKRVPVTNPDFERLVLQEGDVLFVRTNGNPAYVGRCAVFDEEEIEEAGLDPKAVIYASYLIRGRLKKTLEPLFLQHYLQTKAGQVALRDHCRTSAGQYNINTKGIGAIEIPDVHIERQREFVAQLAALKKVGRRLFTAIDESDDLFNSLLQRAFRGEL